MGSYWWGRDRMLASDQPLPSRRRGRRLCGAKTRAGASCQVRAKPGKARWRFHAGKSTGPKTEAGRNRIAEAQRQRWRAYREKQASLHRNAITSDAVTRLWQGDLAHQSASIRERQIDVMNLHHRQLIEAALICPEAIGRTEAHSQITMRSAQTISDSGRTASVQDAVNVVLGFPLECPGCPRLRN